MKRGRTGDRLLEVSVTWTAPGARSSATGSRPAATSRTRSRRRQSASCPGLTGDLDWGRIERDFAASLEMVLRGVRQDLD